MVKTWLIQAKIACSLMSLLVTIAIYLLPLLYLPIKLSDCVNGMYKLICRHWSQNNKAITNASCLRTSNHLQVADMTLVHTISE